MSHLKKRVSVLVGFIVSFGLISLVLVYFWPSAEPKWKYYIEPGIYTASEEVSIDNTTFSLETYMWRDFMPISPPDGKPLIVITKIHTIGVIEFPVAISIERIWIIDGTNISSTTATDEFKVYGNKYEMVFRDGPKWGPGNLIDVCVKMKSISGNSYYLKAVDQPIYRTD